MSQKKAKIEELLALSNDLDFKNNSISGTVTPVTAADIALINVFIEQTFGDDFKFDGITPKANETSLFRLNLIQDSSNYATYQSYIQHKLDITKKINCSDADVIYENLNEMKNGQADYIPELKLFTKFIRCLSENYYQKDNVLIFFSKNYCEVPVQPRAFEKYLDSVKLYKENKKLTKSLQEFLNWITEQKTEGDVTEPLNAHKSELYVIVATEIIENLITIDKNDRIFNLIKNIENVINDTKSKYSLYLDDFKYSKFIEKINKHSEEFLNKVNKVITDLQSQILAIPLTISAITFFKDPDKVNTYIYAGFLVYLMMVFYSGCQQAYNLTHIRIQIKQFNESAKLPKELSTEWKKEIKPVNQKILCHQIFLLIVSLFIGFLIGVCIINIDFLFSLFSKINYFYFFSIVFFCCIAYLLIIKNLKN
ncbi:hypothetical protein GFH30_00910 [Acinetobacter wanghuae]|uniref:Uncharacterized protein n=1 Tax=Acinetobacter wanghuae TaxID=2662362 RepID=A0A5Q0NZV7_9GAMM|nr:hypothetical protein [Acinetobacter wanghuae]MQW91947.1 hypothetical protein [Acinetobacter wanghuae]QGA10044.1 hypothetical protein GFH30_00910 [Acinetobacter wanghuae]